MSDQDIFKNENEKTEKPDVETLLSSIKNEDGSQKYATIEDALKGAANAQEFIPKVLNEKRDVESEIEKLKAELAKRQTLEELAEALKTKAPNSKPAETEAKVESKGLQSDDIDKLLEQKLSQREVAAAQQGNLKSVVDSVSAAYGEKASEHIKNTAQKFGMTAEALKTLSAENPQVALRLLDLEGSKQNTKPTSPSLSKAPDSDPNRREKPVRGAARGGLSRSDLLANWRESEQFVNKRLGVEE